MKYFYFLLITCFFSLSAFGQTGKPLYQPSPAKEGAKRILQPIKSGPLNSIPSARTSIITSFAPPTQPTTLHRSPTNQRMKVVQRSKKGAPIMIKGTLGNISAGRDINLQVYDYLQAIKAPISIQNPTDEFKMIDKTTDELGQTHFKMQQTYQGIKVHGGQVWLHAEDGKVNLFNGRNYPTPVLENITPSISKIAAQEIAHQDVSLKTTLKTLIGLEKELIGEQKEPELLVYHPLNSDKAQLAWHYQFHPNVSNEWEYFIDAQSGEIIDAYKTLCQLHYHTEFATENEECNDHNTPKLATGNRQPTTDNWQPVTDNSHHTPQNGPAVSNATDLNGFNQTINSYEIGNNFFLIDASRPMYNGSRSQLPNKPVGAIWTINAQNKYPENRDFSAIHLTNNNNNWSDPISVSAHSNAGFAYEYFRTTFGRNSINGAGETVLSVINVSDEDGSGLDNAFWTGTAMMYGNGKTAFEPLAKSLDVAGHEIAHGVIQNTANLLYQGESGAMNESFADVFGVLIDRDDYQLGEDVVNRNIFRSGALRDMADPNNGGTRLGDPGYQPANVSEQFFGKQDNGGVHINSGITNRAFFLVANNIGKDKAEQIYYRALTTYLVRSSQFVDLRASLMQSARDIHGNGSQEVSVIAQAFDIVGIPGEPAEAPDNSNPGGQEDIEVDVNLGSDFVLFTNNEKSNLSVADGQGEILVSPFTNTGVLSRPSVTDDGQFIVFVAEDKTIRLITIDASGQGEEEILQPEPIWRNVAVSKDGFRIAALTEEISNTIDVFDFTLAAWQTFELYNPTFAEGISTGEVDYADVLEFDFSGQFVMYDARNTLRGDFGGSDLTFWDIGFVKVYDNSIENFEQDVENNIFKLFSNLEADVSVGNPTFSKNSPDVIAYDYIDVFDPEEVNYELRGINITTNTTKTLFRNQGTSVPSYSRLDDQIIFNAVTTQESNVVATLPLAEDKISAGGDPAILVSAADGANWGVWFSDGVRS
ncbi:MAG: M4 family metallopeptidase [Saprospiraceae bacterium]